MAATMRMPTLHRRREKATRDNLKIRRGLEGWNAVSRRLTPGSPSEAPQGLDWS